MTGITRWFLAVLIATAAVFSLWPDFDIYVAKALLLDTSSPWTPLASTARMFFKNAFTLFCVGAGILAITVFVRSRFVEFQHAAAGLFVAICLAIGPGLVTQIVFKSFWGRARPRQIVELGGTKTFTPALVPSDQCDWNCSFISGEASSIFAAFFILAALIPSARKRLIVIGIGIGGLAGLVRIVQGGHFLSDVLFSALIMFATAFALRWLLIDMARAPLAIIRDYHPPSLKPPLPFGLTRRDVISALSCLAAGLVISSVIDIPKRAVPVRQFAPPTQAAPATAAPALLESYVCTDCGPVSHAGSLLETKDGLHAFWFQGSREGGWDVSIQQARFDGKTWSKPTKVVSTRQTAHELKRYVKSIGNPVAYAKPDGEIVLFYLAISLRGWAATTLVAKRSMDGGASWSPAERIITSPIWNISTLIKEQPLTFSNGRIALPAYWELTSKRLKYPTLIEIDPVSLRAMDITRMGLSGTGLQPAVVAFDKQAATAYLRKNWGTGEKVGLRKIDTTDGGRTWSAPVETGFKNPGGPVGLVSLGGNELLLIFNETSEESLELAYSPDHGRTWQRLGPLSQVAPTARKGAMEAYPYAISNADGVVDIIFSGEGRNTMRHVRLNKAWIDAKRKGAAQP